MLQRGNRVQVPRVVRWRFKLESDQVLKVTVSCPDAWPMGMHFYATMSKDGRIVVPKLILSVLGRFKPSLEGYVFRVILEPS
jgi:bifunctional DNA-binding transcriptional regulator/antitoxin component of YhaV-PrlF toxin-antitoxin module